MSGKRPLERPSQLKVSQMEVGSRLGDIKPESIWV